MKLFIKLLGYIFTIFLGITLIEVIFELIFGSNTLKDWLRNFFEMRIYINLVVSIFISLYYIGKKNTKK